MSVFLTLAVLGGLGTSKTPSPKQAVPPAADAASPPPVTPPARFRRSNTTKSNVGDPDNENSKPKRSTAVKAKAAKPAPKEGEGGAGEAPKSGKKRRPRKATETPPEAEKGVDAEEGEEGQSQGKKKNGSKKASVTQAKKAGLEDARQEGPAAVDVSATQRRARVKQAPWDVKIDPSTPGTGTKAAVAKGLQRSATFKEEVEGQEEPGEEEQSGEEEQPGDDLNQELQKAVADAFAETEDKGNSKEGESPAEAKDDKKKKKKKSRLPKERTPEQKALHAKYMRFSRSLSSLNPSTSF